MVMCVRRIIEQSNEQFIHYLLKCNVDDDEHAATAPTRWPLRGIWAHTRNAVEFWRPATYHGNAIQLCTVSRALGVLARESRAYHFYFIPAPTCQTGRVGVVTGNRSRSLT